MNLQSISPAYQLESKRYVSEINAEVFQYRHQTGARILFLATSDDNKVFSISFRTPPTDSTGVAHILEHSVLCGSRKYPLKEPFVELAKGSLNTFLNAMTFPDKTMYPVASRNAKDFRNLMDVYLDAVFFPRMLEEEEILKQEGWHYELDTLTAPMIYKGVVYNEMKGAFSSPDALLEQKVMETLFPASPYGFESGGDPEVIPQLTQAAFVEFHRKYYHPANSYIFLYGDMDQVETLQFLEEEYLSRFEVQAVDSEIPLQPAFNQVPCKTFAYPVTEEDEAEERDFLSYSVVTGRSTDAELYLGLHILEHILLGTPAAPLKRALLDSGLGTDVTGSYTGSICQPVFDIIVSGAGKDRQEQFVQVIEETLSDLVQKGLDPVLVEASLNIVEFSLREADFAGRPKGLIYNITAMDSWLYGGDPLMHLAYQDVLAGIKAKSKQGYFENLIQKWLLENRHKAVITLTPEAGLNERKEEELRRQLAKVQADLSAEQQKQLVAETAALKLRQATEDTEEQRASIPLLKREDLESRALHIPQEVRDLEGQVTLFHPQFTNQILYLTLYFDLAHLEREEIPWVFLLSELLGMVDTHQRRYADLANQVNLDTGGISFDIGTYSQADNHQKFQPKFIVHAKALYGKTDRLLSLLNEICGSSQFSDRSRICELLKEAKTGWDVDLFRRGQQVVAARLLSYFSPASQFAEQGLFSYYQFLAEVVRQVEKDPQPVLAKLAIIARRVFNKDKLVLGVTADEDGWKGLRAQVQVLWQGWPNESYIGQEFSLQAIQKNEGFLTSGQVQYVARGGDFRQAGYEYHGSMAVLENILRYDYLWNRIRVQGGAYGAFARFDRNGSLLFSSYRDPNLTETLAVYEELPKFLEKFAVNEREMTKYVIGTISAVDAPLTPQMKGARATSWYFRGLTEKERQQEREEILATVSTDIRKLAPLVRETLAADYLCVLGGEEKLRRHKDIFAALVSVPK